MDHRDDYRREVLDQRMDDLRTHLNGPRPYVDGMKLERLARRVVAAYDRLTRPAQPDPRSPEDEP